MTNNNLHKSKPFKALVGSSQKPNDAQPEFLCRSGTAARLADIPVATLRIWERRYNAVGLARSPSGQRLYGPYDINRLVLLKKLVKLGHAIGTIANLSLEALQLVDAACDVGPQKFIPTRVQAPSVTVCVAGSALVHRLNSKAGRRVMMWSNVELVAYFADSAKILDAAANGAFHRADVLLVHLSTLFEESADQVVLLKQLCREIVVVYDFGTEQIAQRLRAEDINVCRDPFSLVELVALITRSVSTNAQQAVASSDVSPPPRRFGDDALLTVASASTTISCECPQHLATILMKLSAFETYSMECLNRNSADAHLHAYLKDVTGSARSLFEYALERVAHAEGLKMPPCLD